ncbi:MAG TPA: hypothetical protein PLZ36_04055, partial [Armatimonadota bacterium]|nr:hypothetical protein [Armatimonadota bacterium]
AIVMIPLADIGVDPTKQDPAKPATLLEGVFARVYHHGRATPEESTYTGVVVHGEHVWSPLVLE